MSAPLYKALVIPVTGPITEIEVGRKGGAGDLDVLQAAVGGLIQALPLPSFIPNADNATAYCNEEGKFDPDCQPNMRATDFMVPGVGLFPNDYISGPFVLCGFDASTGEHAELPSTVEDRARLIEREAG
jgi:hypothetical protein